MCKGNIILAVVILHILIIKKIIMTKLVSLLFIVAVMMQPVMAMAADNAKAQKPRVIVLTDIENEPDDAMSWCAF